MISLPLLWAQVRLVRVPEASVVFAGTLVGAHLCGLQDGMSRLTFLLAASNALLFAAATTFNDWHDVVEDRVNKPDRPVASGQVSRARALGLSVLLSTGALGLAALAGTVFASCALLLVAASALYTLCVKRIPGAGNLLVGVVSTYPLACWMLVAPPTAPYVAVVLGCMALRVGGEVVKTIEDASGDAAAGVVSLATMRGAPFTTRVGLACLSLALGIGALPLLSAQASVLYRTLLVVSAMLTIAAWLPVLGLGHRRPFTGPELVAVERAVTVLMTIAVAFGVPPLGG